MQKSRYIMFGAGVVVGMVLLCGGQWIWSMYHGAPSTPFMYPGGNVTGTLKSLSGNVISVSDDTTNKIVQAHIEDSTVIEHQVDKDAATIAQDQADFQTQMAAYKGGALPIAPLSFTTTPLTVHDLQVGMIVVVLFAPGSDLSTASRIEVLDHLPVMPANIPGKPGIPAPPATTTPH